MMFSKFKWLIVIQLLLNEQALCRVPPPLAPRKSLLPDKDIHAGEKVTERDDGALWDPRPQLVLSSAEKPRHVSAAAQKEKRVQSAKHVIALLRATLQGQIKGHLHIRGKVSCGELLSASAVDDQLSSVFPQELLGLSLVPVMAAAGCRKEAQTLVLKLYDLLGVADTEELLMEVQALITKRMTKSTSTPAPASPERERAGRHIEALMFNIQQLAEPEEAGTGPGTPKQQEHCEGWTSVNGTRLVGTAVDGSRGGLEEAVNTCEKLGALCAGVTSGGLLKPGGYEAVLKKGSSILPSESPESESWIRQCSVEENLWIPAAPGRRMRRGAQRSCTNVNEERVYNVMEWIPAVSTLYNLGTAVYYASVNCSDTAKERAILSAVDLGTDALMVATGGTAGLAGYALGAGVKTGVKAGTKYLLNSMKEEDDVLVNQVSWEDGVMTVD